MENKYFKVSYDSTVVASNLMPECETCFSKCNFRKRLVNCPLDDTKRQQGRINSGAKGVFLCSIKEKTAKLFGQNIDTLLYTVHDIKIAKELIEENIRISEQKKVNRLVHNLSSMSANSIQLLYDLVPQDLLSSNWRDQIKFIRQEIERYPDKTSQLFLRLIKNSIQMKSEFSIYRRLDRENKLDLDFRAHPIRKVILNILHPFFTDFNDKSITVDVEKYEGKVLIDYETIQVALYHLIGNAVKYAKPNSIVFITFTENDSFVKSQFSMTSLFVAPEERMKIFNEGYSGELARKTSKSGDGIGLWRVKQIMELNKGSLECSFSGITENLNGFPLGENYFALSFQKSHK